MSMTFDELQTGKKFKLNSKIVYKKLSYNQAKVVIDMSGTAITDGAIVTSFYKSKMQITEVR